MTATAEPQTPTGVLIGRFTEGSPEWHAARAGGLGGSEVAAVLGLSKWESPFSLWHRKAGRIPAKPQNDEMDAGRRFEAAICGKFADNHPEFHVAPAGTLHHVDRPWQIANPDRLLRQIGPCGCGATGDVLCSCPFDPATAGLEAKFALFPDEWGPAGTDQIPPYYLTQVRWYLDVTGLDVWYLQVFFGGSAEWREYVIRADEQDQAFMRERARAFLDTLERDEPPAIDGHTETYQAIKQLHPAVEDVNVEIPAVLAMEYDAACDAYASAKADKQLAANQVLAAIGNGRNAVCDDHLIATRVVYGDPDDPTIALRPARKATASKGDPA